MAYADKCFYFDWGNREVKLEDFDIYDHISVRRRDLWDEECEDSNHNVSIELWVKDGERDSYEDREIVLSKDNAMVLASKLMRAVAELDADEYTSDLRQDVELLKEVAGDKFDEIEDRWREYNLLRDAEGGLIGAINNFVDTPMGKDAEELPQQYYYIDDCGYICRTSVNDLEYGALRKNIGNWFNTERQAEEAREKIKEVLNEHGRNKENS